MVQFYKYGLKNAADAERSKIYSAGRSANQMDAMSAGVSTDRTPFMAAAAQRTQEQWDPLTTKTAQVAGGIANTQAKNLSDSAKRESARINQAALSGQMSWQEAGDRLLALGEDVNNRTGSLYDATRSQLRAPTLSAFNGRSDVMSLYNAANSRNADMINGWVSNALGMHKSEQDNARRSYEFEATRGDQNNRWSLDRADKANDRIMDNSTKMWQTGQEMAQKKQQFDLDVAKFGVDTQNKIAGLNIRQKEMVLRLLGNRNLGSMDEGAVQSIADIAANPDMSPDDLSNAINDAVGGMGYGGGGGAGGLGGVTGGGGSYGGKGQRLTPVTSAALADRFLTPEFKKNGGDDAKFTTGENATPSLAGHQAAYGVSDLIGKRGYDPKTAAAMYIATAYPGLLNDYESGKAKLKDIPSYLLDDTNKTLQATAPDTVYMGPTIKKNQELFDTWVQTGKDDIAYDSYVKGALTGPTPSRPLKRDEWLRSAHATPNSGETPANTPAAPSGTPSAPAPPVKMVPTPEAQAKVVAAKVELEKQITAMEQITMTPAQREQSRKKYEDAVKQAEAEAQKSMVPAAPATTPSTPAPATSPAPATEAAALATPAVSDKEVRAEDEKGTAASMKEKFKNDSMHARLRKAEDDALNAIKEAAKKPSAWPGGQNGPPMNNPNGEGELVQLNDKNPGVWRGGDNLEFESNESVNERMSPLQKKYEEAMADRKAYENGRLSKDTIFAKVKLSDAQSKYNDAKAAEQKIRDTKDMDTSTKEKELNAAKKDSDKAMLNLVLAQKGFRTAQDADVTTTKSKEAASAKKLAEKLKNESKKNERKESVLKSAGAKASFLGTVDKAEKDIGLTAAAEASVKKMNNEFRRQYAGGHGTVKISTDLIRRYRTKKEDEAYSEAGAAHSPIYYSTPDGGTVVFMDGKWLRVENR